MCICRSRSDFLTTVLLFQLLTFVYLTTQLVTPTTCLSCLHLPHVYIEALEPHLIDRVLILFLQSVHGLPIDSSITSIQHQLRPLEWPIVRPLAQAGADIYVLHGKGYNCPEDT